MRQHAWLVLCAFMAACGGGADSGDGTDTESDDTAGDEEEHVDMDAEPGDNVRASALELIGINPPAAAWDSMSHQDKEFDMIGRFHPIYREIFQAKDGERWAEFGCETCHGGDMRERNFEMPAAHLPPIPAPGTPRYDRARGVLTDMYTFMEEQVTANMRTMLGEDDFSCNGCHPVAE